MKWWLSCCDQGIFEVDKREYLMGFGAWRWVSAQGGRWDSSGRTEVLRAALVKVCTNAEPAFEVSEKEAFEGRISLLMQELGGGEDHQCKGEAAGRVWAMLSIKNSEKEKVKTKNLTWTGRCVLRVIGQSRHKWRKHVFLMRGNIVKLCPVSTFFLLLCRENQENIMPICGTYSLRESFFYKTVSNWCTYITAYPLWSFHEDVHWKEPFIRLIFICILIPFSVPLQTNCVWVCPSL